MSVYKAEYGKNCDGISTNLFTIDNGNMKVSVSDYGATIMSIVLYKDNKKIDVTLQSDTMASFENDSGTYMGRSVGRYANRIADGSFVLDGITYKLQQNDGKNHLHGGKKGFSHYVWNTIILDDYSIKMTMHSKDGDEAYPGDVDVSAVFSLDENNMLLITYEASVNKTCPINLTNHVYFNLNGKGNILKHLLMINSDQVIITDKNLIPTLDCFYNVAGTPFDFRNKKQIGTDINSTNPYIKNANGYDHCFVNKNSDSFSKIAEAYGDETGIKLEMYTDMPGVQLYTGNFLKNVMGKNNNVYNKHDGFCLEAEYFPNSPNRADFPSCIKKIGEKYSHRIAYKFSF